MGKIPKMLNNLSFDVITLCPEQYSAASFPLCTVFIVYPLVTLTAQFCFHTHFTIVLKISYFLYIPVWNELLFEHFQSCKRIRTKLSSE